MARIRTVLVLIWIAVLSLQCAPNRELINKQARAKEDLGLSHIRQGNINAGIRHLNEAARLEPQNPRLQHELALAFQELGDDGQARAHFKRALALKPDYPQALNNLGTLYLRLGQWDKAIDVFQAALSDVNYETPEFAHNNMGLALYHKQDYGRAVRQFQQALKIFPAYGICYANLGLTYEAMHRFEEAIDAYQKAVYHIPQYPKALFYLGRLYHRRGDSAAAAKALKQALELNIAAPMADEAKRLLRELE